MNLDDKICYCFHVSKRKIVNFIRITRPQRASQISECGGAGTGCGWCVPYLKRYFSEATEATEVTEATVMTETEVVGAALEELSPKQYARQRGEYIRDGGGTPPPGAIASAPLGDDPG